jgi:nicotinate phosphoribosyltransferase
MIYSILDTDIYKLTMQAAVLELYPHASVTYEFVNRRPAQKFNRESYKAIVRAVASMQDIQVTDQQIAFLRLSCPYLPEWYFVWLKAYHFDPSEVKIAWNETTGALTILIEGLWVRTILWEVPLLAIVSECYFKYVDTNWTAEGQRERIQRKGRLLFEAKCRISDFSTRRRRNFETQRLVVEELSQFENFVGTSNPQLAMDFPLLSGGRQHNPKGTMAHEWIMSHQYLGSLRHCNRDAMKAWQKVYQGNLGTALTDTLGSDCFFADIDGVIARSFDGLRHDSGPYKDFVEKSIQFYKGHGIDPLSKNIIFSDGLNVKTALEIADYCRGRIGFAFGIGTFFSNDFDGSPAMNIVIKMRTINGVHVVKLSDVSTKAIGDRDALRVARWTVNGTPLDQEM